jgi:hypothetical protein
MPKSETEDQRVKRIEKLDANVRGYFRGGKVSYQVGGGVNVSPADIKKERKKEVGSLLRQWARGIPQGIASTAINKIPAAGAVNILGTGIRAARGKLKTKGPVNVGKGVTSRIGSRMKERIRNRRAKRKAKKAGKSKG